MSDKLRVVRRSSSNISIGDSWRLTIPKRLVKFMQLDNRLTYDLQWSVYSDGKITVKFQPKTA
jgi:hypothetical protein